MKLCPQTTVDSTAHVERNLSTPTNQTVSFHPAIGRTEIYTAHSWTPGINYCATKPSARREDGYGIGCRNDLKHSHRAAPVRENVIVCVCVDTG